MVGGISRTQHQNLKIGPEELWGCVHHPCFQSKTCLGSYPKGALYTDGDFVHPDKSSSEWEAIESHRLCSVGLPVLLLSIHDRWQLVKLILPWLPEKQGFVFFFSPVACTVLVCKMKVLNRMTVMVLLNAKFLWVTFWLCLSSSALFEACLWQYLEVKGCRISLSHFGHGINNHSSLIPEKEDRTPLGVQGPYS